MKKRIFAWIALIGFVILVAYCCLFREYSQIAFAIYIFIAIVFICAGGLKSSKPKIKEEDFEHIELKIGKRHNILKVPKKNLLQVLRQKEVNEELTGEDSVRDALENSIGTENLEKIVSSEDKIVIITSDITRPMPTKKVLPAVMERLYMAGVKDENVTVVFAVGSHRKHTEEEKKQLVGEDLYKRIKCIDSDINDTVCLGTTKNGTPVDIFKPVAQADKVICLGNIEYHYFAGYSGGAKAIMPGVSSREAIQKNHSNMLHPMAKTGNIEGNPVRADIEEACEKLKVDYIVNVVLSEKKEIIKTVAGHYIEAHRVGCQYLDNIYKVEIQQKADIVVVSSGGFPKDINLYQAQKGLDNSSHAVKEGGVIILDASCIEGYGEKVFEKWITESNSPKDLTDRIKVKFELGGHKAAAIASILEYADIYLVSDLSDEMVEKIYMKPFKNINMALASAFEKMGGDAKVIVMPTGGSTLPMEKNS